MRDPQLKRFAIYFVEIKLRRIFPAKMELIGTGR